MIDYIGGLEKHNRSVGYGPHIGSLKIRGELRDYTVKCSHFYP